VRTIRLRSTYFFLEEYEPEGDGEAEDATELEISTERQVGDTPFLAEGPDCKDILHLVKQPYQPTRTRRYSEPRKR
jgi:hypothetical protein